MADNKDLQVNIAKAIERSTRVASLDELKAKGQSHFKVINAQKIMDLIREAVDIAIESMTGQKLGSEREKLQAAAKKEFDELFKKYQQTQQSKDAIEGSASKMQQEIDAIQKLLYAGGGAEAAVGLAGIGGQINQLVQKLQASEKARIEAAVHQKRLEDDLADSKRKFTEMESQQQATMEAGRGVAHAVDEAYSKIDATLGVKARELGFFGGSEPRTPEEKMERLSKIAEFAVQGLEQERKEKQDFKQRLAESDAKKSIAERELTVTKDAKASAERRVDDLSKQMEQAYQEKRQLNAELEQTREKLAAEQAKLASIEREVMVANEFRKKLESRGAESDNKLSAYTQQVNQEQARRADVERKLAATEAEREQAKKELAQTAAKKAAAEKELGELQDFKRKLEEAVDESGSQFAEIHQVMAGIGKRADDLIKEVESGRLKHLKPEEKKIILDAMMGVKEDLKKLQEERAFLEKKLYYMSMTIDSLEAELLAAKGLTPGMAGSAHLKDDGLVITFDESVFARF